MSIVKDCPICGEPVETMEEPFLQASCKNQGCVMHWCIIPVESGGMYTHAWNDRPFEDALVKKIEYLQIALNEARDELKANAAPDLLEMLKMIKKALGPDGDYAIVRADGKPISLCESVFIGDWFEKADAAILKAEPLP
jgi:hypothetical protein